MKEPDFGNGQRRGQERHRYDPQGIPCTVYKMPLPGGGGTLQFWVSRDPKFPVRREKRGDE